MHFSPPPRSQVALGNGTCLRSFASPGVVNDNHVKAVQLPGQVRSQVALGNEEEGAQTMRSDRERAQFLFQLRGNVSHNQRELILIMQFKNMTDPMNLRDQSRFHQRHPKAGTQPP